MSTTRIARLALLRLVAVEVLQLPAVLLLCARSSTGTWWCAALWGSAVCCAGTDSRWRWRNRLLVAQAIVWLLLASCVSWP